MKILDPRFKGLLLSLGLLSGLLAPAWAADPEKTVSLAEVQTIVSGLGLTDTGDKKSYVSIADQGPNGLTISMQPILDGKSLLIFTALGEIAKDKMAAMPAEKILTYNDSERFYFSISGDTEKNLYLQTRQEPAFVSPKTLRQAIDELVAAADETKELWSQDKWQAPGTAATGKPYKALQDEADAAWESTPFAIGTAALTTKPPEGFRMYDERPAGPYKNGETLHMYVEPVYFAWKQMAGDKYKIDLTADLLIKTKSGSTVLDAKKAITMPNLFSSKVKTIDLTADIKLNDSLAATDYVATMTVHDNNASKTVSVDLPFAIAKP